MIFIYRVAHWMWLKKIPLFPNFLKYVNRAVFSVVLPPSASVGRDVLFSYSGLGTVIHKRAVIGDSSVIGTGVTVGGRSGRVGVPVIGKGVLLGTGAKVLGPVTVGDGASIGANAVVLTDVPAGAVAVGIPARVVKITQVGEKPDYTQFSVARPPQYDD